ncbi:MAG: hypothetical protein RIC95_13005 [Vicingaceae bacterium]
MKQPINSILSLAVVFTLLLASCAEAPKKDKAASTESKKEEKADETEKESEDMMEEDLSFMLPSPIQIAAMFNRAGLEYKSGLTNPAENISNYNTKTAKYLNFGVYSADLAYTVLNNQQQESIDYLNAVKSLSDDIGMPSIFGTGKLIKSFEKNIDNQDTILRILTTIKRRTDEYLAENSDKSKEAVFFSAAWVEGMYLGANSPSNKEKLTSRLIEQMTILEDILKAVEAQKDPSLELGFLEDGLSKLLTTFNNFESVKKLSDSGTELSSVQLTESELAEITKQITALRNQITKG